MLSDDYNSGTWGLLYYEQLPPEEAQKRQKQLKMESDRLEKEEREAQKIRKKELKRIWGVMPTAEELVPWIEEKFDLEAMFSDIKKKRRTKQWKEDLENGDASLVLEVVADIGPKRSKDYDYEIAAYFGIPPDVVALYQNADSEQELWEEVFWPFFESLSDAFAMLLPYADLPGTIVVDEDQDDQLAIQYQENE